MRHIAPAGLLAALAASAAPSAAQTDWHAIDSVVVREMRTQGVPGAALAVVVGDSVVYSRGYGVASVETGQPVAADMRFRVASVTKMFTGLEGAILASRGTVDLDAPVGGYLPTLRPAMQGLTLRQLLSHTAGLRDASSAAGGRDESGLARAALRLDSTALMAVPGEVYSYANPGFTLAGAVLEGAAATPYADLVTRDVLQPLGMTHSTFRILEALTHPLALGHQADPESGAPRLLPSAFEDAEMLPRGGLISTAPDLARFAIAVMHEGRLAGARPIAAEAVALATHPQAVLPADSNPARYGLGFRVVDHGGRVEWGHYGGGPGYGAVVRMLPEPGIAVILLANRTNAVLDASADHIFATLLGEPARAAAVTARLPLAGPEHAGVYRNGAGQTLEFVARGGHLMLSDDDELIPLHRQGPRTAVILEDDGKVEAKFVFGRTERSGREFVFFLSRAFMRED